MSLITCCPSCGTKFRVVADQLRISDGWVRCGRCQEVFDASQALERSEVAAAATPEASVPEPSAPESGVPQRLASEDNALSNQQAHALPVESPHQQDCDGHTVPAAASETEIADALWTMVPGREMPSMQLGLTPAGVDNQHEPAFTGGTDIHSHGFPPSLATEAVEALAAKEAQDWPSADEQQPREPILDVDNGPAESDQLPMKPADAAEQAAESVTSSHVDRPELDPSAPELSEETVPSFVRQAQRRAWWNQPAVRFVMGMLVTLLPLALALQIALHERNTLVAWKPQWRPAFESMCIALRCELAPRQHIASVAIIGSSFHEDAQPHHYRLGLSLQNQSITSVATPSVELTLTDSQDQVLVRKVLRPTEIGAPAELAANSEWTGTLNVATQGLLLPVSGYRVMAFYP